MTRRLLQIILSSSLLLLLLLPLCSCNDASHRIAFCQSEDLRLQVGGSTQFVYDPLTCQLSWNRSKLQWRIFSDNMSDFFIAELSEVPTELEQSITANLKWTTHSSVVTRKNLTLEVVRLEGENVWLWSSSARIGMSIRVLD